MHACGPDPCTPCKVLQNDTGPAANSAACSAAIFRSWNVVSTTQNGRRPTNPQNSAAVLPRTDEDAVAQRRHVRTGQRRAGAACMLSRPLSVPSRLCRPQAAVAWSRQHRPVRFCGAPSMLRAATSPPPRAAMPCTSPQPTTTQTRRRRCCCVRKIMNFASKSRNFAFKTRNCVSKTRKFVSKMMKFADFHMQDESPDDAALTEYEALGRSPTYPPPL